MNSNAPLSPGKRIFFGVFFPWIFILVGGGLLYAGVTNLRRAHASTHWPSVPGEVTSSEVERRRSNKNSTTYAPVVTYDYTVGGTPYTSDRLAFGAANSGGPAEPRKVAGRYPAGSKVTVHYSPGDPSLAVLEPGLHKDAFVLPLIGGFFFLFGCVFAWWMPRWLGSSSGKGRTTPLPS
jgi:hypothetical protein